MKLIDEAAIALIRSALDEAEGAHTENACIGCEVHIGDEPFTDGNGEAHGPHDHDCIIAEAIVALDGLADAATPTGQEPTT